MSSWSVRSNTVEVGETAKGLYSYQGSCERDDITSLRGYKCREIVSSRTRTARAKLLSHTRCIQSRVVLVLPSFCATRAEKRYCGDALGT
jgi:hypothetical protein